MIVLALLRLIFEILKLLFSWLELPDMPLEITTYVDEIVIYVVDALPLIWCFVDKKLVTTCLVISLACMNFDKIYDFLMWIIAKIPIGIRKN